MSEPQITLRAAHGSRANGRVTRIVIHDTEGGNGFPGSSAAGQALGTARYFQSASAGGSAHYCVDVATEVHCVPDSVQAWHAPPNGGSIGIEICGKAAYTRAQWLSPQVWPAVQRAAARTRELCQRFGIPMVKLTPAQVRAGQAGVCGHVDVSQAFHQSDHHDPGTGFPWDAFMAEVTKAPVKGAASTSSVKRVSVSSFQRGARNADVAAYKRALFAAQGVRYKAANALRMARSLLPGNVDFYDDFTCKVTEDTYRYLGTRDASWLQGDLRTPGRSLLERFGFSVS